MPAPIRRRTRAREIAMQVLFQFDLRGSDYAAEIGSSVAEMCRNEWQAERDDTNPSGANPAGSVRASNGSKPAAAAHDVDGSDGADRRASEREVLPFAERLVTGVLEHQQEIDRRLQLVARNWDLRRMAIVDRNVMRMAIFELMHCADVPPKVAINEAIEIGKKFSTANSGGFVNGILDRIRIDLERERSSGPERGPDADGSAEGQAASDASS